MQKATEVVPRVPVQGNAEVLELVAGRASSDSPPVVIAAAIVVGTAALMILGVQPVLLEALTHAGRITQAQAGPLATLENMALALGAAVGPSLMRAGRIRAKVAVLGLLLVLADFAIFAAGSLPLLFAVRGAAGLLEGLMLASTLVVLIRHSKPDRMNALFLGLSTLPQAALAYALPAWITPIFGVNGGFASLGVLAIVGLAAATLLADAPASAAAEAAPRAVWTAATLGALSAVALQNAAIGAAWNYLPLLFDHRGFGPTLAGVATSGGLIFQVVGAFAVAAWGGRLDHRWALVLGGVAQAAVILGLLSASAPAAAVALAMPFGLFWLAIQPFQVRLLIDLDETRTAAMVLAAVTLVGLSLGPTAAALGVRGPDVSGAFWIATAMMAAAAATYAVLVIGRRAHS